MPKNSDCTPAQIGLVLSLNVADTVVALSCQNFCISDVFSVGATPHQTVQKQRIELLINGLEVRVLPGSPLISPNQFDFYWFGRPRGIASNAEMRTSENKTPPRRSTAFLYDSETLWIHVLRVVSRFAPEAGNDLLLPLPSGLTTAFSLGCLPA
jgi:hypothetical protein